MKNKITSTMSALLAAGFFFIESKDKKLANLGMSSSGTGFPRNLETLKFNHLIVKCSLIL